MTFESQVISIDEFVSQKGNPCAFVWVAFKGSALPFKLLAYNQASISKAKLAFEHKAPLMLEITQDRNLSPRVEISR